MSCFTKRPRAYSKATQEEVQEIRDHLSKCSVHDLQLLILSAAHESSDIARQIVEVMRHTRLIPPSNFQPVQPNIWNTFESSRTPRSESLTPIDVSDDSEMGGTENVQPDLQYHDTTHSEFDMSTLPNVTSSGHTQCGPAPLKRSNKRKTFADRDCNIQSFIPSPRGSSTSTKRQRPSKPSHSELNAVPNRIHCINCGARTSNSEFDNVHSCIYHPGTFEFDGKLASWSCCGNSNLKSTGCLITQHKGFHQDAWLLGSRAANGLYGEERSIDGMDNGHRGISQYARLISSRA